MDGDEYARALSDFHRDQQLRQIQSERAMSDADFNRQFSDMSTQNAAARLQSQRAGTEAMARMNNAQGMAGLGAGTSAAAQQGALATANQTSMDNLWNEYMRNQSLLAGQQEAQNFGFSNRAIDAQEGWASMYNQSMRNFFDSMNARFGNQVTLHGQELGAEVARNQANQDWNMNAMNQRNQFNQANWASQNQFNQAGWNSLNQHNQANWASQNQFNQNRWMNQNQWNMDSANMRNQWNMNMGNQQNDFNLRVALANQQTTQSGWRNVDTTQTAPASSGGGGGGWSRTGGGTAAPAAPAAPSSGGRVVTPPTGAIGWASPGQFPMGSSAWNQVPRGYLPSTRTGTTAGAQMR